jgi:hypothetical protein
MYYEHIAPTVDEVSHSVSISTFRLEPRAQ